MIAKQCWPVLVVVALGGCAGGLDPFWPTETTTARVAPPRTSAPARRAPPGETAAETPAPEPDTALGVETTALPDDGSAAGEDLLASVEPPAETGASSTAAPDGRLGTTTVSPDATLVGFQFKTPLVATPQTGRVVYTTPSGEQETLAVQLLPSGGPAGGGSQMSINAMTMIGAPLTGLPQMVVYVN